MPTFSYVAKDAAGKSISSKETALSEQDLKVSLSRRDLVIVSIKEVKAARVKGYLPFLKPKISTSDLVIFCKQLATMIKGGVPILRAIDSITEELKNPLFKATLSDVSKVVKDGGSLSLGLKKFPDLFSSLFIAIVEAGEKVGSLEVMLRQLSKYLEARDRLNRKIVSALTYPAFILVFFAGAVGVITVFLIPRFKSIYGGFGAKLPFITRAVFGFSDILIKNAWLITAVAAIALFLIYSRLFKSKAARRRFDSLALKIPVFGTVIMNAALSKFSRTLAILLGQGIPVAVSLELVSRTSGNIVIEESGIRVRDLIMDGSNIPDAIRRVAIFPSLMIQMVSVGVESGSLPELLDNTADFYEERVDSFVAALTTMIEPVLIVLLGVTIGVVVVALYMPIFKLSQAAIGAR